MNSSIKAVIDRIYFNEDKDFYQKQCAGGAELDQIFHDYFSDLEGSGLVIKDVSLGEVWPSKEWRIGFGESISGEFNASFETVLKISKIHPVFYTQHEFTVQNKCLEKVIPCLDGFSDEAYIMSQYNFQEQVDKRLENLGHEKLYYPDMTEVICNLSFPEDVSVFGTQVTLEYALFHDVLNNLCP
jgi:hypothetical protein